MGVLNVMLSLNGIRAVRDQWSLSASGTFREGVHLVTGDVGSGKSTLALIMAGFFVPSEGSVIREKIKSVMLSLQFPELAVTGFTVADECASWGVDPREILETTGLTLQEKRSPLSLSRGELKRLHLACVLAKEYDLLLLDEPFSSLDCQEKINLCARLRGKKDSITVIFTHEQSILPRVDRIWEIADRKLIDCKSPPDAFFTWHHVPAAIMKLMASGQIPENVSRDDLMEAECRIRGLE